MKFGIVGYGRMGKVYHDVLKELEISVDFVCDVEEKNDGIDFYNDYKIALESTEIDGIIVTTYGPSHYEIVKYAIQKNVKYIICEKPFTTSVKHANEIVELLKNSNSRLTVGYLRRFSNAYELLLEKLHRNLIIGDIKTVIITSGAGGISTLGTHFLDLCSMLLSEKIQSVYGIPINKNHPNPRGASFEDPGGYFILNFEKDKRAFIDMGDDLGLQPKIEIIGSYGRIEINEITKKIIGYCRKEEEKEKPMRFYGLENEVILNETFDFEPLNNMIKKMIENLISGDQLKMTPEMARDKVEIYSAIRKSFFHKENVSLPLEDEYYEKEFMVT